jgi:circadian clock protein KaiC
MAKSKKNSNIKVQGIEKAPTGIMGLDEITGGGFPRGRTTLLCGGPGCGKTIFATEFIVRGVMEYGEPGVFVSFEESEQELTENVRSLGFDLDELKKNKKLHIDHILVHKGDFQDSGSFDLEGLFVRIGHAIDSIGAKRVVLDTIETLFFGFENETLLRNELKRLFTFLKKKKVTAVITGEKGVGDMLSRKGFEEYVSDCVIMLDNRVEDQVATRRLRIVKYRGSTHGTNEYPFIIDHNGIAVLPITSLTLRHEVSLERVSSGIKELDSMLSGKGFFRGSSVLISGTAGTGKTILSSSFADAACKRGEKVLYLAFEESPNQLIRNMKSVNLNLEKHVKKGNLLIHAERPTLFGLEMHLVAIHKMIMEFKPDILVMDPITNLIRVGKISEVKSMLMRLIDFLKVNEITAMLTALIEPGDNEAMTDYGVSSLIDTWILLRDLEIDGERNRGIYILKSRGMSHSKQIREFIIGDDGVDIIDVYLGPAGILTGSARAAHALNLQSQLEQSDLDIKQRQRELERKRKLMESQIQAIQAAYESEADEVSRHISRELEHREKVSNITTELKKLRGTNGQRNSTKN